MATARLRKVFRYPDDDERQPDELDEEQQEKLIADLQQRDVANSRFYNIVFTSVPTGAALYSVVTLFSASSLRDRLVALCSLASVAATAYFLLMVPLATHDKKGKKPIYVAERERSLTDRYLPYLIAMVTGALLLSAFASWLRGSYDKAATQAMPAVVFGFTLVAREQLRPLQWQELQQARYELKGA